MILLWSYLIIAVIQSTSGSVIADRDKITKDLIAEKSPLVDKTSLDETTGTSSSKVNSVLGNKVELKLNENSGDKNPSSKNYIPTTIITSQAVSVKESGDGSIYKNTALQPTLYKTGWNVSESKSNLTSSNDQTENRDNQSTKATATTTTEPAVIIPKKTYSSTSQVIPALRAYQKYLRPIHISPNYAKLSKSVRASDIIVPARPPAPRTSTPCPHCGRLICGNNGRYCPCQTYRSGLTSNSNNAGGMESMWRSGLLDAALNPGRTLRSWFAKPTTTPEVNRPINPSGLGQTLDYRSLPNQPGAFQIQPLHDDVIVQPRSHLPRQEGSFYAMLNNQLYPHSDGCLEPIIP